MSEPPFDLKLLPDWLKEESFENPYADHAGEPPARPGRDSRGGRPPERRGGGPSRDARSSPRGSGPPSRDGRPKGRDGGARRGEGGPRRDGPRPAPQPPQPPADVAIEFLPEAECLQALVQQIQAGSRAFPLFGLARVFLEKPERHRVRITSRAAATPLYQTGEGGSVSLDRREKDAFDECWERYYAKETVQREPLKGNYTNVARCRLSGALLGPTNHHSYQSALRKHYEERFQRRMSFPDFQREIEVVSDPKLVDAWKEEARSSVRYTTSTEPEPVVFESAAEAEEHFRKNYLEREIRAGQTFEITGQASREVPDQRLENAIRDEWEKERRFPVAFSQHLRRQFTEAGLHIFKYHKRVLFVSAIRPTALKSTEQGFSENITGILRIIEKKPRCNRSDLAAGLLAGKPEAEQAKLKAALAGDLRWLIHAGHVIEFHDGTLDLPIVPRPESEKKPGPEKIPSVEAHPDAEIPSPSEHHAIAPGVPPEATMPPVGL